MHFKVKIEQLICNLVIDRLFFPVLKSEINCASDGSVETTKTSLPCFPAVDQLVSWISRVNSVPLGILLSCIPRKFRQHGPTAHQNTAQLVKILIDTTQQNV